MSALDSEDHFSTALVRSRDRGSPARRVTVGPHMSDFSVTHLDKNVAAAQCSTGEQKALLIGLTLAHARAQAEQKPILLLDEVAAHLDIDRRAALIEELLALGTQLFMSGTDASLFEAFEGRAQMLEIRDSSVSPR